jgi:predicted metalloprotease with PDZ domain
MKKIFLLLFCAVSLSADSQNAYRYFVDLTSVKNDQLAVTLETPQVTKSSINFHFPKIIPGTYRISDFGQFVSDLKAFDKSGKGLPVKQLDVNTWSIGNANKMSRITYTIEDSWDSEKKNDVFTMAGTNIEDRKNFVVNAPGFFGYFDEFRTAAFELTFKKPQDFFGSSPLKPASSNAVTDLFVAKGIDELYDSPIMYCIPDTTTIRVGGADIMISVYSPKRKLQSAMLAQALSQHLNASAKYLGGALPLKHYAFLFYFNGEQKPSIAQGALEHNYSSFYTIQEAPPQQIMKYVLDVTGHEFFHVLTPLNFSSKEIKQFNFEKDVLSQHLWLYEGSTEYASDHVQVKYGLNSIEEFLDKLSNKIRISHRFNDTVPFTRLSKFSTTIYKEQYENVYEKGALISACLDLQLLQLSDGTYGIQQLKHDLAVLYGKDKYFNDDELFDVITKMTYPEIGEFFRNYVSGNKSIPYQYYFAMAGVKLIPEKTSEDASLGGFGLAVTPDGKVIIPDVSNLNEFGKKMGYQQGDIIVSMQGKTLTPQNLGQVVAETKAGFKPGEILLISILRGEERKPMELSATMALTHTVRKDVLELAAGATESQTRIRNAWLSTPDRPLSGVASADDVKDINSVINALYSALSGPAGPRNWERFRSLFYPAAQMASAHNLPNGQALFMSMTFEEYIQMNAPFMEKSSFYEEELGRKLDQFGNIAVVKSAYQYRFTPGGKIEQRGINNISVIKDRGRWYISNITWQDESTNNPIPAELLK